MTPPPGLGHRLPERLVGIGAAMVLTAAAVLLVGSRLADRAEPPTHPPAQPMTLPVEPIPAEADPFRGGAQRRAIPLDAEPRPGAQRRTSTYRSLRAYPGAPPYIPHALTTDELREARCNACHERGGFSARFQAYVPVTSHPEHPDCLQCHVPDGDLVGLGFPDPTEGAVCQQCHTLEERSIFAAALDWEPAPWPPLDQRAHPEAPPLIPHDLHFRGNCLACHGGPEAVADVRTAHPERTNCRQCHLAAEAPEGDEVFVRSVNADGDSTGRGS